MKKQLFLLVLAVAAMTSCTNDEIVDVMQPTQNAIGFESFVNKTTRVITYTNATNLSKFFVNGYYGVNIPVFTQLEVSKGGDGSWGYTDEKKYWTTNTYYFAAYAQGNEADAPTNVTFEKPTDGSHGTLTIKDYAVGYTAATDEDPTVCNAFDLVADIKEEIGTQGRSSKVDFALKHLLSKIKFTIYNTDEKFPMTISDLTISGVVTKGTFASSYTASWAPKQTDWTMSDKNTDKITITPIKGQSGITANTGSVASAEFLVLPQELSNVTFSITANYYDGNDLVYTKTFTSKPVKTDTYDVWEPNKYYEYSISLPTAAKPIEFGSVGVAGWGDAIPVELNSGDTGTNGTNN